DLTSDSRKAAEGIAFICIRGLTRDGHDFAPSAHESGAVIIADHDMGLAAQVVVENTREAFAAMCENFFGNPLEKLRLIGITGTNGKTSTTYILKHVLEKSGHKTGLIGTIQNMIGDEVLETHFTTPDTYELHELFAKMVAAGCEYCVMEVSSFGLEQGRVAGLHFDTACFTNLTQDHLDVHGSMEAYFAAKCILFERCDNAVINIDDEWGRKIILPSGVARYDCSAMHDADIAATDIECSSGGVRFGLSIDGSQACEVCVGIPGHFTVYNLLSVIGCATAVGIEKDAIVDALSTAKGVKGRAEVFPCDTDYTIILDYAHSPDGVENILSSMREVCKGRLVVLLGCGGDRDPVKRPLMGETASRLADFVIVTSDNPRSEEPMSIIEQILPGVKKHDTEYVVIENRRDAIEYAVRNARTDDVIVLAGKGHETYQILSTGTIHFDEREVLAEIFEKLK
ncbi:MAG: UDP-N-acetylmuramoyl-L-alanyl-D-glutamate--2,6-diaminopimelate ligase, partial [Clostridia bacterium]|nr:UDP-N-acetylmuramoyl-L-alanyl-D-glutamate--2,6-diaminopimelate ligase [Clostridia bacterium]